MKMSNIEEQRAKEPKSVKTSRLTAAELVARIERFAKMRGPYPDRVASIKELIEEWRHS